MLTFLSQNYFVIQEGGPFPKRHICGSGTNIYLRLNEIRGSGSALFWESRSGSESASKWKEMDPDPHLSEKQDPDPHPHQSEKVEALEDPIIGRIWIRIRLKVGSESGSVSEGKVGFGSGFASK